MSSSGSGNCPGGGCPVHKPVILFYGFEGMFTCSVQSKDGG